MKDFIIVKTLINEQYIKWYTLNNFNINILLALSIYKVLCCDYDDYYNLSKFNYKLNLFNII